jgi:hypothetical protein
VTSSWKGRLVNDPFATIKRCCLSLITEGQRSGRRCTDRKRGGATQAQCRLGSAIARNTVDAPNRLATAFNSWACLWRRRLGLDTPPQRGKTDCPTIARRCNESLAVEFTAALKQCEIARPWRLAGGLSLRSDVEMRPIRVDFGVNETYGRGHILMRYWGNRNDGPGKLFGYVKVSTADQDWAVQREALRRRRGRHLRRESERHKARRPDRAAMGPFGIARRQRQHNTSSASLAPSIRKARW